MDHLMESKEDERTVCGRVQSGKQSDGNLKKNSDRRARPRAREPQWSQFSLNMPPRCVREVERSTEAHRV